MARRKTGKQIFKNLEKLAEGMDAKLSKVEYKIEFGADIFESEASVTEVAKNTSVIKTDVEKRIKEATNVIINPLTESLNAALAQSWNWKEGTRNIIDTGELKDSLNITVAGGRVQISYSAPYASLIHYGGYITPYGNSSAEKVYIPGRPWISATLEGGGPVEGFDIGDHYRKYL